MGTASNESQAGYGAGTGLTINGANLDNDLLTGKAGGQTITGGTAGGEGLLIRSTSNAAKGFISLGATTGLTYDETNKRVGINNAAPDSRLQLGATLGATATFGTGDNTICVQSAAGTFPGLVLGNDSTHQIRLYWQDSSAQMSTVGGTLDISAATAVTFYTTTGGRITSNGTWVLGNPAGGDNALSRIRISGTKTIASGAGATWNSFDMVASTCTISGSTNITTATGFNFVNLSQPTLSAATALTVTTAATLYIADQPVGAGAGPATLTNKYALFVDAGLCRFDGDGTVVFELPADATGNTTNASGRVPIKVGGATKYLRYFDS